MSGCNILLLEDEPLILIDLEYAAEDRHCRSHCATDVAQALRILAGSVKIDAAVLDVSLRDGETCVPVARELDRIGVPYLLHSGDLNRHTETVRQLGVRHIPKPADANFVIDTALSYVGACEGGRGAAS